MHPNIEKYYRLCAEARTRFGSNPPLIAAR